MEGARERAEEGVLVEHMYWEGCQHVVGGVVCAGGKAEQ